MTKDEFACDRVLGGIRPLPYAALHKYPHKNGVKIWVNAMEMPGMLVCSIPLTIKR